MTTASYICLGGALERTRMSLYAYLLPHESMYFKSSSVTSGPNLYFDFELKGHLMFMRGITHFKARGYPACITGRLASIAISQRSYCKSGGL